MEIYTLLSPTKKPKRKKGALIAMAKGTKS
jgi:hypothetical protein